MRPILLSLFCLVPTLDPGVLRADGLVLRLPSDGARVKYDLQTTADIEGEGADVAGLAIPRTMTFRGTVTLGSVGRARAGQQDCRWIEIGREIPGQDVKSVLKLLIPERYLGREEDPFSHVLRMEYWKRGGAVKGFERIRDEPRIRYELERLRGFFPERLRDVKSLGKRVIQTPLGPVECEGRSGTAELKPSPLFPGAGGEWAWKGTVEVWEDDKSPFGVVLLQNRSMGYETVGNTGKKLKFKSVTTLVMSEVGDDAVISPSGPPPSPSRAGKKASVKGTVTGPDGHALAGVRVLFEWPGPNGNLASVTEADGTYAGESPVGMVTVRVTHRTVGPDGKARAVILFNQKVEVPAEGGTFDFITQKDIPKRE